MRGVVPALGLARIAPARSRAVEQDLLAIHRLERFHPDDPGAVGLRGQDGEGLLADGGSLPAPGDVAAVVLHLLPGSPVDDGLVGLVAGAFLALLRGERNRAELDPSDGCEGLRLPVVDLDPVEAGGLERPEELALLEGYGDATAPELRIVTQCLGHRLVADDVGYGHASHALEHAEDLANQLRLLARADKVEDAVRHHDVDGVVGDERFLAPQLRTEVFQRGEVDRVVDRILAEIAIDAILVEPQVLNLAAPELDVRVAHGLRHRWSCLPRQLERLVVRVDADHASRRTDHLSGDEADLSRAAAQVENRIPLSHVDGRIPAAVVALEDLPWDRFEEAGVVAGRTAERRLADPRGLAVPLADGPLDIETGSSLLFTHRPTPSVRV